ncbi:MAG TPA: hypothetical protein VHX42_02015 [Candidatus Babeliales bacterium]|jgi:hypothetical protein|nr:hypothetical protein [Candidatus Babeliales bacterium]
MKSTQNVLITSVTLTIALFASIHIKTMELDKPVNLYLTDKQKNNLEVAFFAAEQAIDIFRQGVFEEPESLRNIKMFKQKIELEKQRIERIKAIYYGNKAYTDSEMANIIYSNPQTTTYW